MCGQRRADVRMRRRESVVARDLPSVGVSPLPCIPHSSHARTLCGSDPYSPMRCPCGGLTVTVTVTVGCSSSSGLPLTSLLHACYF